MILNIEGEADSSRVYSNLRSNAYACDCQGSEYKKVEKSSTKVHELCHFQYTLPCSLTFEQQLELWCIFLTKSPISHYEPKF